MIDIAMDDSTTHGRYFIFVVVVVVVASSTLFLPLSYAAWRLLLRRAPFFRPSRGRAPPRVFGFFHPRCSGGGGGERVLWKMVQVLQSHGKEVAIYTIDPPDTDEAELRRDASRRFDVRIDRPVKLISLEGHKDLLLPSPYLSLVLESFGTMKLAYRALQKFRPDVFCDTTGCAFAFLVARWMLPGDAKILAYVHYPTISTDMMMWEWQKGRRRRWKAKAKTFAKLAYYWGFAVLYGIVGSLADLVMVNSTWTYGHIASLWRLVEQVHIVYPPCRVPSAAEATAEATAEAKSVQRQNTIVSIGQFRPEKDHPLQLRALARLLELHPQHEGKVRLLLVGSCRDDGDRARVAALKDLARDLKLGGAVRFSVNPPHSELRESLRRASVGIHTMRQEHFGIGVVEMMAAGLLTVAHDSGGPKADIISEPGVAGFLARTADDYARAIHEALSLDRPERMRERARRAASRFSDAAFDRALERVLSRGSYISSSSTAAAAEKRTKQE